MQPESTKRLVGGGSVKFGGGNGGGDVATGLTEGSTVAAVPTVHRGRCRARAGTRVGPNLGGPTLFVGKGGGINMPLRLSLASEAGMEDVAATAMRPAVSAGRIVICWRGAVGGGRKGETTYRLAELLEFGHDGGVIGRRDVCDSKGSALITGRSGGRGVIQSFAIHLGEMVDEPCVRLIGWWKKTPFPTTFREKTCFLDEVIAMTGELGVGNGFAAVCSKTRAVRELFEEMFNRRWWAPRGEKTMEIVVLIEYSACPIRLLQMLEHLEGGR